MLLHKQQHSDVRMKMMMRGVEFEEDEDETMKKYIEFLRRIHGEWSGV
jgi:deoxyadenosine/deoxycytidine kinase